MKILVLGINFSPEIIGTAVYTSGLVKHLAEEGNSIYVVTAQPYYPSWRVFKGYNKYWYTKEVVSKTISITRCPHYVPSVPTGTKRILHHTSFALFSLPIFLWKALIWRPDIVFVVAPSLISAPVGWIGARLSRAKCWLHVQDLEVEAAFATGLLTENTRIGWLARVFEKWIFSRFDKISSISEPMLEKISEKGVVEERLYELRNWADLSHIEPNVTEPMLKEELGITVPYVLLYSGNIANKQGLDIIPKAAKLLMHRQDIAFIICGDGSFATELKEMCSNIPAIRFFPLQPKERLNELLSMATMHILPQVADATDLVLPSKLTNMLASGRPVIATAFEGTALAKEIEGCGIRVEPGNYRQLAETIEELLEHTDMRTSYGNTARARALERWNSAEILGRFSDEIKSISA